MGAVTHRRVPGARYTLPLACLLAGLAATLATVAVRADTAIYGGIGFGYTGLEVDQEPLAPVNLPDLRLSRDLEGSAAAARQFLGLRLGPHLAFEGGYFRYGTVNDTAYLPTPDFPVVPPFPGANYGMKIDGFEAYALGIYPVNQDLEVFGKLGMAWWDSRLTTRAPNLGLDTRTDADGSDLAYGIGFNYLTAGPFQVRLEVMVLDIDAVSRNWNVMASGIYAFRFGR